MRVTRDPKGPVVLTVFGNMVRISCACRACLINYCLHSCSSLCKLFLLAGIRKSKQRALTMLLWGRLSRVNAEAGALPTFQTLGVKAGRPGCGVWQGPLWWWNGHRGPLRSRLDSSSSSPAAEPSSENIPNCLVPLS